MDVLALLAGLGLPSLLGAALLLAATPGPAPGRAAWALGCGWFVGAFLLTLWMRALSLVGVPFGALSIGLPLAVAAGAAVLLALRRSPAWRDGIGAAGRMLLGANLPGPARLLWCLLLAWLALRFALLLTDVLLRPLYPWDAWTQWATKARVWFELRRMAPFVDPATWLATQGAAGYVDAAPHYPATVPLLQTWTALLLGRWDDALVNLPWWLAGIAFGLALYGEFARRGHAPVAALVGAGLVVTLPLFDVHVALGGYADLWMAAYFTLATLAGLRAATSRRWTDALLFAGLLVACLTIKNPGKVWLLIALAGAVVAALPRRGLALVFAGYALAFLAVLLLAQTGASILGYRLQGQFRLPWAALAESWFMLASWNLLWWGALALTIAAARRLFAGDLAPLSAVVLGALAFLLFGFAFTNAGTWVEDQSTVNRATLPLAPLVVVWMMTAWRTLREAWATPAAAPADPASAMPPPAAAPAPALAHVAPTPDLPPHADATPGAR